MGAYVRVQRKEFEAEPAGYTAVKHQAFVGTEYFDEVATVISSGTSSTTAMSGSTETAQFKEQTALATPQVPSIKPEQHRKP
jgi:isocitrate lyase